MLKVDVNHPTIAQIWELNKQIEALKKERAELLNKIAPKEVIIANPPKQDTIRSHILKILNNKSGLTCQEITDAMGSTKSTTFKAVNNELYALVQMGALKVERSGRYNTYSMAP